MVSEYLYENPEVFVLAIGALILIIIYSILSKRFGKGTSFMIGLAIAGIASWSLWRNDFYGYEITFVYLMYAMIALVILKAFIWPFIKSFKR